MPTKGLGDAWAPIQRYWREASSENREAVRKALSPEGLRWQYTVGVPNSDAIAPEGYTLDAAMIARPGNMAKNVKLYPSFRSISAKASHRCWRSGVSTILSLFPRARKPSGETTQTLQLLDTGHFALETHVEEIAFAMKQFLAKIAG